MKKGVFCLLTIAALALSLAACGSSASSGSANTVKPAFTEIDRIADGSWQAQISFPDWAGYVDDTLAMNSMYSFNSYEDQGKLYFAVDEGIESFDLFINNIPVDTSEITSGCFELDLSPISLNGTNTVQITNVVSDHPERKITVSIPYPVVLEGTLEEAGINPAPFELIDAIISADVENGFSSAQLALIKDGKLVYQNAWGLTNSYRPDGTRITDGTAVTNDTLYDLASNTKMYAGAFAIQYLADRGLVNLDDKVIDLLGKEFADNTLEIRFASFEGNYPGLKTIKEWKAGITVKNLMMHQAGFPGGGHYHNQKYDTANQELTNNVDNVLFVENASKEKTFKEGICKTPLMYEPGTKTMYSDIDYMVIGLIVEKITGQDLDTFLSETFWQPLGLEHITYRPLDNGFAKDDCAATELNGNTRDGLVDFPGVRTQTVQGEVHDEESYYTMEGVSGHAGLFASAADLAKLAWIMMTGGYEDKCFFSKNTRDLFISPQAGAPASYGIGWWREADDKRVWYFGTQSPESTIGHQGWTGTLTMIDFENNMVMVFLTNSINTPILEPTGLEHANDFSGRCYTTATLGFVPQILYTGMISNGTDPGEALESLIRDMISEKQKLIVQMEESDGKTLNEAHPGKKALEALEQAAASFSGGSK